MRRQRAVPPRKNRREPLWKVRLRDRLSQSGEPARASFGKRMRATRAVIHLENLRHNVRLIRAHIGQGPRICMAVKADAYGHGAVELVRAALSEGVDYLAVATVDEGAELRAAGVTAPILLLSIPLLDEVGDAIRSGLALLAGSESYLAAIEGEARKQGRIADVHLKVDTGMGRIGCTPERAPDMAARVARSPRMRLAGIGTHFPVADMAADEHVRFTREQVRTLAAIVDRIRRLGIDPGLVHAANSGAVISYPESHFDLVRPGIILYGYYPSRQRPRPLDVRPVMGLESRIVFLKRVPAGTGISYGLTYHTSEETTIATIPCGYGDGYSRLMSGRAKVLVDGALYPVAGRVCMDQLMIDLGPRSNARLYDPVVLFGPDEGAPTAEDLADIMGTIPYEITCNINKRVPRVYLDAR